MLSSAEAAESSQPMTSPNLPEPATRIDAGALGVGDGLLMLLRELNNRVLADGKDA